MPESSTPSVIVGLAAGISFMVLFAIIFAPPTPQEGIVLTGLGDAIVETHYRFSDVDAKMQDIQIDLDRPMIRMTFDVPKDTELTVRFHEALLEQLEHTARPEGYRFGDYLVIFVDKLEEKAMWEYAELEAIATIPLEAGARTIEIVPTVGVTQTNVTKQ